VHAVEIRPIFFEALMVTNLATGLVTLSVALTLYAAAHGDSAGGDNLSLLDGAQGGVRGIIGKGGRAEGIERIDGVYFLKQRVPEVFWILKTRKFGPLVVGMNSYGKSVDTRNKELYD
jgi:tartrate dehydratase beta subunit/fumarate hydratase class I family protein